MALNTNITEIIYVYIIQGNIYSYIVLLHVILYVTKVRMKHILCLKHVSTKQNH